MSAFRCSRCQRTYDSGMLDGSFYLVAAAGSPNYGDDFIARAWLRFLATEHPHVPVWLDCLDPGVASIMLGAEHPNVHFTNTLWGLTHLAGGSEQESMRPRMQHFSRELGTPRLDLGVEALRSVRSIHLVGGGYLNDIWVRNLGIVNAVAELHRAFGVRVFATGQGLLPNAALGSPGLADDLAQFEFLEARDSAGAAASHAQLGLDDAFLDFDGAIAETAKPPRAVVLVQGDFIEEGAWADLEDAVHRFARSYAGEDGEGLAFLEFYPPLDSQRWPSIGARYPQAEFVPFQRLWQEGLPIVLGQHWFTTRFHGHLLAAANGASGVAVSVSTDYYATKHQSLVEVGTAWRVLPLDDLAEITTASDPAFPDIAAEYRTRKLTTARSLYPQHPRGSWLRRAIRGVRKQRTV